MRGYQLIIELFNQAGFEFVLLFGEYGGLVVMLLIAVVIFQIWFWYKGLKVRERKENEIISDYKAMIETRKKNLQKELDDLTE